MYYIELPEDVEDFKRDDKGYHYFTEKGVDLYLYQIIEQVVQRDSIYEYTDRDANITITVHKNCPKVDRKYIEYTRGKDIANAHCELVNGQKKHQEINQLGKQKPWYEQSFLSEGKKIAVKQKLDERKKDRWTKGPNSY